MGQVIVDDEVRGQHVYSFMPPCSLDIRRVLELSAKIRKGPFRPRIRPANHALLWFLLPKVRCLSPPIFDQF